MQALIFFNLQLNPDKILTDKLELINMEISMYD